MPDPRPFSLWWVVAAVPVALGVGWLAGGMPVAYRPPANENVLAPPDQPSVPTPVVVSARPERATSSPVEPKSLFLHTPEPSDSAPPKPASEPAPTPPEPARIFSEWTTYDEAMRQSRENHKPVLLDFNADWCGPCQRMRSEVFEPVAASATLRSAVIPVSLVDRIREDGANSAQLDGLQRQFDVRAFPTLIVLDPASGRSVRFVGYAGPTETLRWITEAADSFH